MTLAARRISPDTLQWLGVLAAPLAWAVQLVSGIALDQAQCDPAGRQLWHISVDAWTLGITIAAALVGVGGLLSALTLKRRMDDQRGEDGVRTERRRFLAIVGLALTPLFLCIIVMSGVGALAHQTCVQS